MKTPIKQGKKRVHLLLNKEAVAAIEHVGKWWDTSHSWAVEYMVRHYACEQPWYDALYGEEARALPKPARKPSAVRRGPKKKRG